MLQQSVNKKNINVDSPILHQIHFDFLSPYPVAGMGEPWIAKMSETHVLLKACGIGAILTLTEDNLYGSHHLEAGFFLRHEPVDDGDPPTTQALERSVAFIEGSLMAGRGVAVHCLEGRGRTGTILCAWLAFREHLTADSAIARVRQLRPYTALSVSQKKFLKDYLN
jgi:atypical dual specificity phosphatase